MKYFNFNKPYCFGHLLCPEDKEYVLMRYTYRFTGEHRPEWAIKLMGEGKAHNEHFPTDLEWLKHTLFNTLDNGRLDKSVGSCHTTANL